VWSTHKSSGSSRSSSPLCSRLSKIFLNRLPTTRSTSRQRRSIRVLWIDLPARTGFDMRFWLYRYIKNMMPTFSRPLSQRTRSGCALNRCLARSNIFRTVLARLLLWASSLTILLEKPSTQLLRGSYLALHQNLRAQPVRSSHLTTKDEIVR